MGDKFKAWDERLKKWSTTGININIKGEVVVINGLILVQYIGRKDINGVEICSGDIVKWDDMSNGKYWRIAEVKIDPDIQFVCLPNSPTAPGRTFRYGGFAYQDTHNHLTIIGNKFENPELMEAK